MVRGTVKESTGEKRIIYLIICIIIYFSMFARWREYGVKLCKER